MSLQDVVLRLVTESVLTRLRHRAMLALLEESATFDYEAFHERFHEIGNRDADAMFAKLLLPEDSFRTMFAEWISEDANRYRRDAPKTKKIGKQAKAS